MKIIFDFSSFVVFQELCVFQIKRPKKYKMNRMNRLQIGRNKDRHTRGFKLHFILQSSQTRADRLFYQLLKTNSIWWSWFIFFQIFHEKLIQKYSKLRMLEIGLFEYAFNAILQ